jgi:hypothetical protein
MISAIPPVHARGRLWTPAFARVTKEVPRARSASPAQGLCQGRRTNRISTEDTYRLQLRTKQPCGCHNRMVLPRQSEPTIGRAVRF